MYHEVHGPADAPAVLLSSGLGGAAHYWGPNIAALAARFRVIAYDQLGTGRSPGTLPDGYSIGDMAREVAGLLDSLNIRKTHFVGHALGGLVGLRLAKDRPSLLDRMIVVNAWAKTSAHTLRCFAVRKSLLLNTGVPAYVAAQPLFLYPAGWMADRQDWLAEQDAAGVAHFPPIDTVLKRIGAIEAFDIQTPPETQTLIVATKDDVLVPYTCSVDLAAAMPNGRLVLIDQGGHACNITDPAGFDTLAGSFLSGA